MRHILIIFSVFLFSLTIISCSSSDGSKSTDNTTTTTDTTAPTVSSVSTTADNQSSVSITDNITVTFSEAMDTTYVTTNTSDTYCSGTLSVSSDNFSTCVKMSSSPSSSNSDRTFTLDPYDNLTVSTTYKTRVTTGVKDTAGNTLSSQYETSSGFTTSSDNSSSTSSAPVINNLSSAVSIDENQTSIVTISATGSGSMSYSLSGTDVRLMSVSSNGVITLNSNADYEQKTSYSANAIVTNSEGSTSKAFTVNVTDVSEKYIIDLLLVYHADTLDDAADEVDTPSELLSWSQSTLETNQNKIFTDSQVTNLELNVLGIHSWNIASGDADAEALQYDQTVYKEKIRKGADRLGALLPGVGNSSYGWRSTIKERNNPFQVTSLNYQYNKFFPHELGHTLGLAHSREQALNAVETGAGITDYAHGLYTSADPMSTIMGYGGGFCHVYSNPDLTCGGSSANLFPYQNDGTEGSIAAGVANTTDASRVLQEYAHEYERIGPDTNYGVSVGTESIKSSAYFPLINNGTAAYSFTESIDNTSTGTKTMYVEQGSNVTDNGTTYTTFYWCDTTSCDMNYVNPFNTGDTNHKFGILFYLNSGNYYMKTIGWSGTFAATTPLDGSIEREFQNPCLFINHYMKTGQYNEADCSSRFEDTFFGSRSTYYDTWNFTNYVRKELVVTPYGAYDTYKVTHSQLSLGAASNSGSRSLQIFNYWLNPEVGVVMFEDEMMRRWKLTAVDTDGDGTDNSLDSDDDGDGVADTSDAFPLDPNTSADADSDGIADGDE